MIFFLAFTGALAQSASDIEYHLSIEEPGIAIEMLQTANKQELGSDYYRFYAAAEMMRGELLKAQEKLERGFEQFPGDLYLKQLQGEFFLQAGSNRQALELYENLKVRARQHDPELYSQVIDRLSYVYLAMGTQAVAGSQFHDAAHWFQKVTNNQPESIAAWHNLAVAYYQLQRYDDALDSIEHALIIDENHEPTRELRFAVLAKSQRMDRVIELLEQGIENDPKNLDLHLSRLRALIADQRREEADEYAELLMEKFSHNPALFDELAAINRRMGHAEGELSIIRKKREAFPDNPEILIELSSRHEAMRDWDKAAEKLDTLAGFEGYEETAFIHKGRMLELQQQPDKAAEEYRAGLEIVPESEKLLERLGWVLMDLEDFETAAGIWENLYRLHGKPEALFNQAVSKENAEGLAAARTLYEKLTELEEPYAKVYFSLARYHASASEAINVCRLSAKAVQSGYKEVLEKRTRLGSHMEQLASAPQAQREIDRRPEQLENTRLLLHNAFDFVLKHCSEHEASSVLLVLKEEHGERGEIIYFAAKKEFENRRYDEALALVKKSISRMPEQPEAHVLQARIYEYQENWHEARRAWHRYQSLQPESELGYRSLISAYRQTGDLDALVQRWQPYYLTNPENEQLRKYLREILFRLGRHDEAAGL